MLGDEGLLQRDDLVGASVCVEGRLDLREENDGAIGASTSELPASLCRGRERDGVVEGETEGLMCLLCALVVEEVLHDVVPDGEEGAARRIGRSVLAVGASDTTGERS